MFDETTTSPDGTSSADHALLAVNEIDVLEEEFLRGWKLPRLDSFGLRRHVCAQEIGIRRKLRVKKL